MNHATTTPRVVTTRDELRAAVAAARLAGHTIGFVPTMGALHAGHVSLVEASRREQGFTVASIFVNPTQFGPGEDFERYPRPLEADLAKLAEQQVDLVFAPPTDEIYRPGGGAYVEAGPVAEPLEGLSRPGHFRGVATVVLKLFNLVTPDVAYFGRKDYQQSLVIRRMTADFDLPIEIRVCPTVREADGLALSSRNVYLSPAERRQVLVLSRSLRAARELVERGERDASVVLAEMLAMFAEQPEVRVEYIALVDGDTLADAAHIDRRTVALVAACVGKTRLIDNEMIGEGIGDSPLPGTPRERGRG